jgi:glyoxylate reductase
MAALTLFATKFPDGLRRKLENYVTLIGPLHGADGDMDANCAMRDVRILITMGVLKTDAAVMDALPQLGLICCYGTGYEGVDLAAAAKRGILVTHSPGANASSVADHAMGLLLAVVRNTRVADNFVRAGRWRANEAARLPLVRGLTGRRMGIFGFGEIGRKIAQRATAFDMQVAYHSRAPKDGLPYAFHPTLQSLADWADVLMVAARADSSNRHAVGEAVLKALGPQGVVVNIARGSLIDEAALIALLTSGDLGGAGLDVFENEPAVPEALRQCPNVVLTPHIAGGTHEAHEMMQEMVAANVRAFLAGQPLPTVVPELAR